MTFETTDSVQTETKGGNYVYELYRVKWSSANTKEDVYISEVYGNQHTLTYPSQVPENIEFGLEFDREILKYGITDNPKLRYRIQKMPGYGGSVVRNHIQMNVLNSNITRGEAYYLEGLYAMQYAKKYGAFPTGMTDRTEEDINWGEEV